MHYSHDCYNPTPTLTCSSLCTRCGFKIQLTPTVIYGMMLGSLAHTVLMIQLLDRCSLEHRQSGIE